LTIQVILLDLVFRQSYRKHQVRWDLIKRLSHINFLGTTFLAPTARVKHRSIERFRIEIDLREFLDLYVQNCVFWDVGACVGNFSVYAAQRNNNVYSFEPDGLTFSTLVFNTGNSNLNIVALPIALGNKNSLETLNMRVFEAANAYNTVGRNMSFDGTTFEPGAKLACLEFRGDYLIEAMGLPIPNYIKIDVDGNELQVLEGLGLILKHHSLRGIAIELIKDNPESVLAEKIILENGFAEIFFHRLQYLETNRFFLKK
jgi:FkbM family methyltransferase